MNSQFTAAWACWHVDLNNAAVQWGWTVETRPKPSFQISLAGVDYSQGSWNSVTYTVLNKDCCKSKDYFHWTAPCSPCTLLVLKVGDIPPPPPPPPRLRRPCLWSSLLHLSLCQSMQYATYAVETTYSVASNYDFIIWLTVQLSHPYNKVDHT